MVPRTINNLTAKCPFCGRCQFWLWLNLLQPQSQTKRFYSVISSLYLVFTQHHYNSELQCNGSSCCVSKKATCNLHNIMHAMQRILLQFFGNARNWQSGKSSCTCSDDFFFGFYKTGYKYCQMIANQKYM